MKQIIATAALLALALALAACQQEDPNNIIIDEGNAPGADIETLPPDEGNEATAEVTAAGMPVPPDPVPPEQAMGANIPAKYHGRWGMTANDCQRGRSDAKGLIVIGEQKITFYESVATLKEQRPAIAASFSGLFSFTGEGQHWEKVMTFTRTDHTLKRADDSGTFTYQHCG